MASLNKVGRDEQKFPGRFDPADYSELTSISGGAYDLVARPARIPGETVPDPAPTDRHLDVGKGHVVVHHLFDEMRNRELQVSGPKLLADPINDGQQLSSVTNGWLGRPRAIRLILIVKPLPARPSGS
jgi:hypothetical protein